MPLETSWRIESIEEGSKLSLQGSWGLETVDLFFGYINEPKNWDSDNHLKLEVEPELQDNLLIIGILLNLSQKLNKKGYSVTFYNPTDSLKKTLEETGRSDAFQFSN